MTTAEQLRAAADVLRRHGWTHGRWYAPTGERCAVASLDLDVMGCADVILKPPQFRAAMRALISAIGVSVPATFDSNTNETLFYANIITAWNDADGQTAENVISTLELAAICHEQQCLAVKGHGDGDRLLPADAGDHRQGEGCAVG